MGKGAWNRRKTPSPEVLELEQSLQATRALIAQAYAGFNSTADGDLVESYIYEIQSLQARYSYLLRRRKALDSDAQPLPARRGKAIPSCPPEPKPLDAPGSPVLPVA